VNRTSFVALSTIILLSGLHVQSNLANAEEITQTECKSSENITVGIRLTGQTDSAMNVQSIVRDTEDKFASIAKEIGVTDIKPGHRNISINSQAASQGGAYNYNGNVSFRVKPALKAYMLADHLKESGYMVNMNSSTFLTGNCQ